MVESAFFSGGVAAPRQHNTRNQRGQKQLDQRKRNLYTYSADYDPIPALPFTLPSAISALDDRLDPAPLAALDPFRFLLACLVASFCEGSNTAQQSGTPHDHQAQQYGLKQHSILCDPPQLHRARDKDPVSSQRARAVIAG